MPRARVTLTPELTRLMRAARAKLRLSQAQAAELAGVSTTWWRRIETGNKPRGDAEFMTVANMLAVLGVTPGELTSIDKPRLAGQLERWIRARPDDKRELRALLEGLSSEEVDAVVAFIGTLRNLTEDRRRISQRGA